MPEVAGQFVKILNDAAQRLHLPKGPVTDRERVAQMCQAYFRAVGSELARVGRISWVDNFPGLQADEIARTINAIAQQGGAWQKIQGNSSQETWKTAQDLANEGVVVVGAMAADNGGHGHLGFVVPLPPGLDTSMFDGQGPFVRDGNEHKPLSSLRMYPSTFGAVKASKAFVLGRTGWYVWVPSAR